MAVCIPTYTMASSLIGNGMTWWQAVLTVFLGNLIVLIPMTLNAHPGTAYGIPFPVLLRASFGTRGANIAALLRGVVACGWFGIQTWFGGAALHATLAIIFGFDVTAGSPIPGLGITAAQLACFLFFWVMNVFFIWKGMESIKWLEKLSAPFLLIVGVLLMIWAVTKAGGFGAVFAASSPTKVSQLGRLRRGTHRDGRLLGHALAEHPGLLPLREIPARPDLRPGDRAADDHDVLLVRRHRRHRRDRGHLRRGHLGSRAGRRQSRQQVAVRTRLDRARHRHALHQHRRQRRLPRQ